MRPTRSQIIAPLAALALASVGFAGLAASVDLKAAQVPAGIPAMPQGGPDRLDWSATSFGQRPPEPVRVPGTSTVDCFQWPDGQWTQTPDRLSPSCVATYDFTSPNGGESAPGVDAGTIKVGVPAVNAVSEAIADYLNRTYQMYGRSISLVELGPAMTPAQQASFIANASSARVFAATPTDFSQGYLADPDGLASALADAGIVSVLTSALQHSETLTSNGPYPFSTRQPLDLAQAHLGEFICNALSGDTAKFSAEFADTPRKFAIFKPSASSRDGNAYDVGTLEAALAACGVDAPVLEYGTAPFSAESDPRDAALFAQLKASGVTSLLYFAASPSALSRQAYLFGDYRPEIITTGDKPAGEAFGLPAEGTRPPGIISLTDQWQRPVDEQSFSARILAGYPLSRADAFVAKRYSQELYRALSVIAAGIQAAGPNLSADTFRAGLEATYWPNPGHGRPPEFQGGLGFQRGDHVQVTDYAIGIWNYDVSDPYRIGLGSVEKGFLCTIGNGQRFGNGVAQPSDDSALIPLHTGQCPALSPIDSASSSS